MCDYDYISNYELYKLISQPFIRQYLVANKNPWNEDVIDLGERIFEGFNEDTNDEIFSELDDYLNNFRDTLISALAHYIDKTVD